jgi:hypothetical protein
LAVGAVIPRNHGGGNQAPKLVLGNGPCRQ